MMTDTSRKADTSRMTDTRRKADTSRMTGTSQMTDTGRKAEYFPRTYHIRSRLADNDGRQQFSHVVEAYPNHQTAVETAVLAVLRTDTALSRSEIITACRRYLLEQRNPGCLTDCPTDCAADYAASCATDCAARCSADYPTASFADCRDYLLKQADPGCPTDCAADCPTDCPADCPVNFIADCSPLPTDDDIALAIVHLVDIGVAELVVIRDPSLPANPREQASQSKPAITFSTTKTISSESALADTRLNWLQQVCSHRENHDGSSQSGPFMGSVSLEEAPA